MLYQKSIAGDSSAVRQLRVMSDGGSFFATAYLTLAMHTSGTSCEDREAARELAQYLLPVLESKRLSASLTKDEAYIFSEICQQGIGREPDARLATQLTSLTEELRSHFRQEPEIKSREKLISLHLQLLDHSVKCNLCSSKNCKKMKVRPSVLLTTPPPS